MSIESDRQNSMEGYRERLCNPSDSHRLRNGAYDISVRNHHSYSLLSGWTNCRLGRTFRKPTCPARHDEIRECVPFSCSDGLWSHFIALDSVNHLTEALPTSNRLSSQDVYSVRRDLYRRVLYRIEDILQQLRVHEQPRHFAEPQRMHKFEARRIRGDERKRGRDHQQRMHNIKVFLDQHIRPSGGRAAARTSELSPSKPIISSPRPSSPMPPSETFAPSAVAPKAIRLTSSLNVRFRPVFSST